MTTTDVARHRFYVSKGNYFFTHRELPLPEPGRPDGGEFRLLHPDVDGNGGLTVITGTFYGHIDLTVEVHDSAPGPLEAVDFEVIEELHLESTGRDLVVRKMGEVEDPFPVLPLGPDDRYAVRIGVQGIREANRLGELDFDDDPVEHHRVQLWREA
jgi:hypothetical protein